MATRSFIAMLDEFSDEYHAMYCHWDGYPEGVGVTLRDYFNRGTEVYELIQLGGISVLNEGYGETAVQGNINGDSPKVFRVFGELLNYYRGCGCEYGYVFSDSKWQCYALRPTKVDLYSLGVANV